MDKESVRVIKVVPPEFQFIHAKAQAAYVGPTKRTFMQYPATSLNSTASVQFNITPSSRKVVIKKNIHIAYPCSVTFTGTPVGGAGVFRLFQLGVADAPRWLPVGQNATGIVVSLDGCSSQVLNSGQYIDAMARFSMQNEERNQHMSTWPSFQDPLGPGASPYSVTNPGTFNAFTGIMKNPLSSGQVGDDHRGDFPVYLNPDSFGAATPGSVQTANFLSVEPLLGLQLCGQTITSQEAGFYNVGLMAITVTLQSPLNWWSHDATKLATLTSYTSSFYGNPTALLEYWTPPRDLIPNLPLYYPISKVVQFRQQNTAAIASGATFTVNFNGIQVSSIPQAILLFCKAADGQQLSSVSGENAGTIMAMDNYAGIPRKALKSTTGPSLGTGIVSVTFDNDTNLLNDATAEHLYAIAVQNGLVNTSFSEWCAFGGVHKLQIGKDVQLSNSLTAGSSGTYNLQVQAVWQNNYSQSVIFTPQLIVFQEGHYEIGVTQNSSDVDVLTAQELQQAKSIDEPAGKGKGLFGTLAKISNYVPVLNSLSGLASTVAPVLDQLAGTEYKGEGMYMAPRKRLVSYMEQPGGVSMR